MRKPFRYSYVLIASMCVACVTPAPPRAENVSAASATLADTDLQDYQLRALETHIQRMPDGPERDYFSGMLAARSGRSAMRRGRMPNYPITFPISWITFLLTTRRSPAFSVERLLK